MSEHATTEFNRYTKYLGRNARVDRERQHHGKMVPHGASTMTDEEFWGKVHETARLQDLAAQDLKGWERSGHVNLGTRGRTNG